MAEFRTLLKAADAALEPVLRAARSYAAENLSEAIYAALWGSDRPMPSLDGVEVPDPSPIGWVAEAQAPVLSLLRRPELSARLADACVAYVKWLGWLDELDRPEPDPGCVAVATIDQQQVLLSCDNNGEWNLTGESWLFNGPTHGLSWRQALLALACSDSIDRSLTVYAPAPVAS